MGRFTNSIVAGIASALVFAAIFSPVTAVASEESKPKFVSTSGTIVAFAHILPACLNGLTVWSAIILLDRNKPGSSRYVVASTNVPCEKAPEWTSTAAHSQKLKLVRSADRDIVLDEVAIKLADQNGQPAPGIDWTCRSGADCTAIPYGKVVPAYNFADSRPIL